MAFKTFKVNYELDYEYFKEKLLCKDLNVKKLAKLIGINESALGYRLRKKDLPVTYVFAILDVIDDIDFNELFKPVKLKE
jgi:hypothetical protein